MGQRSLAVGMLIVGCPLTSTTSVCSIPLDFALLGNRSSTNQLSCPRTTRLSKLQIGMFLCHQSFMLSNQFRCRPLYLGNRGHHLDFPLAPSISTPQPQSKPVVSESAKNPQTPANTAKFLPATASRISKAIVIKKSSESYESTHRIFALILYLPFFVATILHFPI